MADVTKIKLPNGSEYDIKDSVSGYITAQTTLAGYGITDAKIDNGSIILGSNSITPLTSFTETDPTVPSWAKAASKPTYTAAEVSAIPVSAKGAANGVAELDTNGLVPSSQLPSYVDDVLEYSSRSSFPTTGETGKIYVDTSTNLTYRWSGSAYVEISPSLALGTTSSTAFRGDYGQSAYTHAVTNKGSAFASGLYKITTNSEGHVTAAVAATASDIPGVGDMLKSVYDTNDNGIVDKATADASGNNIEGTYVKSEFTRNIVFESNIKAQMTFVSTLPSDAEIYITRPVECDGVAYNGIDCYEGTLTYFGDESLTAYENGAWVSEAARTFIMGLEDAKEYGLSLQPYVAGQPTIINAPNTGDLLFDGEAQEIKVWTGSVSDGWYKIADLSKEFPVFIYVQEAGDPTISCSYENITEAIQEGKHIVAYTRGPQTRYMSQLSFTVGVGSSLATRDYYFQRVGTNEISVYRLNPNNVFTWSVPRTFPNNLSSLNNDVGYITSAGAPVQSVNGQTGSVILNIPTVPTNISAFINDAGYLTSYTETDPIFTASAAYGISSNDISNWNNKADAETTLAGYGITDAYISNGTITLGSNSITPLTSFTESDPVFTASAAYGISSSDITNWNGKTSNTGTVTQVTAGTGLKKDSASSGGDITTSGTINHINSVTAQNTSAVYPITIDSCGHIASYGSAVTIPVVPTNVSSFTNDAGYITSAALSGYVASTTTANLTVSDTAPSSPSIGDIWIDTSSL